MAHRLDVVIGDNWSEFSGWQSRELYTTLFRRPPIWNTRTRRWVTVPDRVAELIAAAEHAGWQVTVHGGGRSVQELANALASSTAHDGEQSEAGGLW